jgi:uncharacterized protein
VNVSVAWDRPKGKERAVVVLAHGAGGDLNDALLRGVAAGLAADGCAVLRFNFPYREAGRRAPGSQKQSEDSYREIATSARKKGVPLFCGGKSYGGRIASHIASDGFEMDGLIFLGYPLHAPGRTDRLRDEHLRSIKCPMLFCQGTKDAFATPLLLRKVVRSLSRASLHEIEGGDHSFNVRGTPHAQVVDELVGIVGAFVRAPNR